MKLFRKENVLRDYTVSFEDHPSMVITASDADLEDGLLNFTIRQKGAYCPEPSVAYIPVHRIKFVTSKEHPKETR